MWLEAGVGGGNAGDRDPDDHGAGKDARGPQDVTVDEGAR